MRAVCHFGKERPALQAVKPYFAMMFSGWLLYSGLNAILLIQMAVKGAVTVDQTFWFGNAAALCRVLPLLLPEIILEGAPSAVLISQLMFALSGLFGLIAMICLAANLWRSASA